jgi:hypothetical protein
VPPRVPWRACAGTRVTSLDVDVKPLPRRRRRTCRSVRVVVDERVTFGVSFGLTSPTPVRQFVGVPVISCRGQPEIDQASHVLGRR